MNAPVRLENFQRVDQRRSFYLSIRAKFFIALGIALAWTTFSVFLAQAWMHDLGALMTPIFALWALTFIAFVPGFMNAFLATSLLLDARPARKSMPVSPGVTLLIADYNEEAGIKQDRKSVA
jgi:biofilm PGA synthesis N-glycosyltransferase PgaC